MSEQRIQNEHVDISSDRELHPTVLEAMAAICSYISESIEEQREMVDKLMEEPTGPIKLTRIARSYVQLGGSLYELNTELLTLLDIDPESQAESIAGAIKHYTNLIAVAKANREKFARGDM